MEPRQPIPSPRFQRGRFTRRTTTPGTKRPISATGAVGTATFKPGRPSHVRRPIKKTPGGFPVPVPARGAVPSTRRSGRAHRDNGRERFPIKKKAAHDTIPPLAPGDIRIIPLGGVEQIGQNMTALEFRDQIIVIDAGIEFTDEDTPGIDYIIPNTTYLEERMDKVKALVITHGHLDHIGAIPYVLERIGNPPIFTREFGALLIQKKLEEFPHLPKANFVIATKDDGALPLSADLKVRFFGLTHSIPDSTGVIIETPYGDIVSTGDVRVDNIDGVPLPKEIEQYKFFKERNVLLFTMDSTGVVDPGWSPSESQVVNTVDKLVKEANGRLIIATFASQVERIISFIEIAKKYNRYVVIEGRSMKTNMAIVQQLNLTDMSHVINADDMGNYPPQKIMMIATGGQGEEFAALVRIANKTHRFVRLEKSDMVILSSSVIPGNEGAVDSLKDNLYRSDAKVVTYIDNVVHASGHGKRAELSWIHQQIKYKYFMPIHGHHHRLKIHAELSESLGTPRENIIVPDNGSIIEIRDEGNTLVRLKEKAPSEVVTVEGDTVSNIQDVLIRDRKILAEDGIFIVVIALDAKTRKLRKSPDIISRGFVYLREAQELLQSVRTLTKRTAEQVAQKNTALNFDFMKKEISDKISQFLLQKTLKRPIVIPVVLSV